MQLELQLEMELELKLGLQKTFTMLWKELAKTGQEASALL